MRFLRLSRHVQFVGVLPSFLPAQIPHSKTGSVTEVGAFISKVGKLN